MFVPALFCLLGSIFIAIKLLANVPPKGFRVLEAIPSSSFRLLLRLLFVVIPPPLILVALASLIKAFVYGSNISCSLLCVTRFSSELLCVWNCLNFIIILFLYLLNDIIYLTALFWFPITLTCLVFVVFAPLLLAVSLDFCAKKLSNLFSFTDSVLNKWGFDPIAFVNEVKILCYPAAAILMGTRALVLFEVSRQYRIWSPLLSGLQEAIIG